MIMLLAIPATVFLVNQQLQTSIKAEKSTTLSFSPVTKTATSGEKISFDIYATPGTNLVNYIKLVIKYDSLNFSADEQSFTVDPASKLKLTQTPRVATGSVTMILSAQNPADSITQETKLGSIAFDVIGKNSTESQISFDSNLVQIRSLGSNDAVLENVFLNGTPATVSISGTDTSAITTQEDTPTVTTPSSNQDLSSQTPAFEGTATPNEAVNITIHSDQAITAKVTADANGNWTYTPTTKLSPGTHTITITTKDSNGVLKTITQTFSVLASEAQASGGTTQTPVCTSLISDVNTTGQAPYTIGFVVSGSNIGGVINKATFNFGDGSSVDVTQGGGLGTETVSAKTTHTYTQPGSFSSNAILTDDQGAISSSTTCTLGVTITGTASASVSPIPATGPSPAVIGIGVFGAILLLLGSLLFFVI